MKKMNKKGFTLMEMLIVIAIIAILIAIAIPTFTAALEKSRQKTDLANARALKSLVVAQYMAADEGEAGNPIDVRSAITAATDTTPAKFYIAKDGQKLAASGTTGNLKVTATWKGYTGWSKGEEIRADFDSECTYKGGAPDLLKVS